MPFPAGCIPGGIEVAKENLVATCRRELKTAWAFAVAALVTTAAVAAPNPLRGAEVAEVVRGANGEKAEIFHFEPEVAPALIRSSSSDVLHIDSWPLAPGERGGVTLNRREVYSPEAIIYRVDATGAHEIPRSTLRFYVGAADQDRDVRVFVQVDPDSGAMQGLTLTPRGAYDIRPAAVLARSSSLAEYVLARADVLDAKNSGRSWTCGEEELSASLAWMGKASPSVSTVSPADMAVMPMLSSLHTATVAIDTDNELLFNKFADNTTTATNFIASLIAQMSVMYERDLLVQLLQGTTFLRLGNVQDGNRFNDDPWIVTGVGASIAQLNEFTDYWGSNYGFIPRAVAAMLSGKGSASGASGIAIVPGAMCDPTSSESFSQVFLSGTSPSFGDVLVVGHEIGHNFGSPHTHCYSPPIDHCYNLQAPSGCYAGPQTCPAAQTFNGVTNVKGTLMSYCHLLGGCSSSLVFHPVTVAFLSTILAAADGVCVLPAFRVSSVSANNGPTAGGQSVTIRGGGFVAGATVTIGGAAATGVVVVNSTTITALTPPHAAGAVNIAVTIPQTASLSKGYLYADPGPPTGFFTLTPCRVLDTRNANGPLGGPALIPTLSRTFNFSGVCGIPPGAKSVSLNVTVVSPAAAGQLELFPGDAFSFGTNSLSFSMGVTRANNAVLGLAVDGSGSIGFRNASPGNLHVIADVNGYFQ